MARRPFASLLLVAGLALALTFALLMVAFARPLGGAMMRCTEAGGICASLLGVGRAIGSPLLLAQLPWSLWCGLGNGWRQWRATHVALARLRREGLRLPAGLLQSLCADLGLTGRVAVLASEAPLALCCGVWRPRIWISTGTLALLPPAELAAVLRHERVHLRRRHPLQLLIARSLAAALPFLPLLRELATALPRAQELAADREVIRAGGRRALGRALLTLVEVRAETPLLPLAAGMVSALDARIGQLTGAPTAPARISRLALFHTVLIFGVGLGFLVLSAVGLDGRRALLASLVQLPVRFSLPWQCLAISTLLCALLRGTLALAARARLPRRVG